MSSYVVVLVCMAYQTNGMSRPQEPEIECEFRLLKCHSVGLVVDDTNCQPAGAASTVTLKIDIYSMKNAGQLSDHPTFGRQSAILARNWPFRFGLSRLGSTP